jgi:hypothetical protein
MLEFTYRWLSVKPDGTTQEGTSQVHLPSWEALYRQLNEWNRPSATGGGFIWKYWY